MNELRRLVYLQAMGTDAYVSRCQLPGAAVTRRLAIQRQATATGDGQQLKPTSALPQRAAPPIAMPRIGTGAEEPAPAVGAVRSGGHEPALRFSLAAVTCGGWLWLEELEGKAFAAAQLQLVQAMAEALHRVSLNNAAGGDPRVVERAVATQFDWPMHANRQLDQGPEAARSSVAAFVQRKLDQPECSGLVLLGRNCEARLPLEQMNCARLVRTCGTMAMLRDPLLKRQAWRDLRPFYQPL